jgi:hypothetical protein
MATNNSTATTPEELAEQFPQNGDPGRIWYYLNEDRKSGNFTINNKDGEAVYEAGSYEEALEISRSQVAIVFAEKTCSDSGVTYFNPLIGHDAAETFSNISAVLGFVHDVMEDRGGEIAENGEGIRLLLQTAWTAAQYSGNLHNAIKEATEVKHA